MTSETFLSSILGFYLAEMQLTVVFHVLLWTCRVQRIETQFAVAIISGLFFYSIHWITLTRRGLVTLSIQRTALCHVHAGSHRVQHIKKGSIKLLKKKRNTFRKNFDLPQKGVPSLKGATDARTRPSSCSDLLWKCSIVVRHGDGDLVRTACRRVSWFWIRLLVITYNFVLCCYWDTHGSLETEPGLEY